MRDAHRCRGIEAHHFTLVAGYLSDALIAAGVDEPTTGRIIETITPLVDDIVSRTA